MKYELRMIEENSNGEVVRNKLITSTNFYERAVNMFNIKTTKVAWIKSGKNKLVLLEDEKEHRRYEF